VGCQALPFLDGGEHFLQLASFGVPKTVPHRLQHQRITSSFSLILAVLRNPHRLHGGAVGCAESMFDMI